MNLKDAVYKCLDAHAEPMAPEQIAEYIQRVFGVRCSLNNLCTRLPELANDPRYCVRGKYVKGRNGNSYKVWYIPSVNTGAQGELF